MSKIVFHNYQSTMSHQSFVQICCLECGANRIFISKYGRQSQMTLMHSLILNLKWKLLEKKIRWEILDFLIPINGVYYNFLEPHDVAATGYFMRMQSVNTPENHHYWVFFKRMWTRSPNFISRKSNIRQISSCLLCQTVKHDIFMNMLYEGQS